MAKPNDTISYAVGVLVVSDTISAGEKEDTSGAKLVESLKTGKYFLTNTIKEACVPDKRSTIRDKLKEWADVEKVDLVLTVGGTGFSPRDVTPEATKEIIDREAPHLASYMVLKCCDKTKFAVLSRSVCGMRGDCLILNLPGSAKGSIECFDVVGSVLPHALDQLKQKKDRVSKLHSDLQSENIST